VLDDHERRALEEIERYFAAEAREPDRADQATSRSTRPPGFRVVATLGSVSLVLLVAGAPVAALAWAAATAIGWSFWRLWPARVGEGRIPARPERPGDGQEGRDRRPGESIRRYLRWLAEAE
jgi:hypothetical protein